MAPGTNLQAQGHREVKLYLGESTISAFPRPGFLLGKVVKMKFVGLLILQHSFIIVEFPLVSGDQAYWGTFSSLLTIKSSDDLTKFSLLSCRTTQREDIVRVN